MQELIDESLPVPQELLDLMKLRAADFRTKLESLINSYSCENGSDTPDFILADYVMRCLAAFDAATVAREQWYGRQTGGRSIPPQAHSR